MKASASIFQYQKDFGFFSTQDAFKLFDSIVKPVLCYGSEIWRYGYYEKNRKSSKSILQAFLLFKKVQVGNDQEKAQSEKKFQLQKPRCEKTKLTIRYLYHENIW